MEQVPAGGTAHMCAPPLLARERCAVQGSLLQIYLAMGKESLTRFGSMACCCC